MGLFRIIDEVKALLLREPAIASLPAINALTAANQALISGASISRKIVTLPDLSVLATATNMFSASSKILGLKTTVLTAVTTSGASNTYSVGTAADPDAFGLNLPGSFPNSSDSGDHTVDPLSFWAPGTTGQSIILDAPGAETFTGGSVSIEILIIGEE